MGAEAAVPWALDALTAAHLWLLDSRRVTAPRRAMSSLSTMEKQIELEIKTIFCLFVFLKSKPPCSSGTNNTILRHSVVS